MADFFLRELRKKVFGLLWSVWKVFIRNHSQNMNPP